jgi:CheY-like chemotaxis protein
MRVLVVDGTAASLRLIGSTLESLHCEVIRAGSAEEGWEQLRRADAQAGGQSGPAPHLAVIDSGLPGEMGAPGLIRRIRQDAILQGMAVVLLRGAAGADGADGPESPAGKRDSRPPGEPEADETLDRPADLEAAAAAVYAAVYRALGYANPAAGQEPWAGCALLVVEDEEINQMVARHILEKMDLRVTIAGSGLEAVALAAAQPFDAVFMDIGLPDIDGYEAAARIRAQSRPGRPGEQVPIIAMTATTQRDPEKMRQAGLNDFLYKPIDLDRLRAILDKWLRPTAVGWAIETALAAAPQAPGRLDSGAALERLAGNRSLYQRLLKLVRVKHAGDAGLIRSALLAGNVSQAHLLVHTLKGVAGTIGATWLQDAAQGLEHACARPEKVIDPRLVEAVDSALASALQAVDLELAEMEPPA